MATAFIGIVGLVKISFLHDIGLGVISGVTAIIITQLTAAPLRPVKVTGGVWRFAQTVASVSKDS